MGLSKVRIGDFVEAYREPCGIPNLTVWDVSGVNRDKEFFLPSKQVGKDTSKYKVVPPGYFACNLMHVGRDVVLPIALNQTNENKVVSQAYTVFYITDETTVLKEYFYILLNSKEMDRYFWFHTDSSVRDGLDWSVFCEIELDIPDIPIQKKYVDIYRGMQENISALSSGQEHIQRAISAKMNEIKTNSEERRIGDCIDIVEERNTEGVDYEFLGVNRDKTFMPTVASTGNLDNRKYKIIRKNRFVYSGMQTGRDKCIRISLYNNDCPAVVSPAYTTFEISDKSIIPEYFFLLFMNPEMDRLGWFMSDSSVRSNLDWDRFCEIKIPLPSKNIQEDVANFHRAFIKRRGEIEQLQMIQKTICPILIRGAIAEGGQL